MSSAQRFTPIATGFSLAAAFGLLLVAPSDANAEKTTEQIVDQGYCMLYYQGDDWRAKLHMEIFDEKGNKRARDLTILRRDGEQGQKMQGSKCGDQMYYMYFHSPNDVKKMSFMVWKVLDKLDDDRWLYMPALDLVKRIAPGDKRTSFFGSHFYYEDMSGRHLSEDTHTLDSTTKTFYVIKSVPKDKDSVEFAYYKTWIHKKTMMPTKTVYYNNKGDAYRHGEVTKIGKVQGHLAVQELRMSDTRIGGHTIITLRNIQYDMKLPKDVFSERNLRQAPQAYIR